MSTQASVANKVETVEIDLSEKGLTELAKTLVQSGRMSAPSFANWCSRVSAQGSRWARTQQDSAQKSKNDGNASKTSNSKDGNAQKDSKKVVKDNLKLSGFMKAYPSFNAATWKDVLGASDALKRTWYLHNKQVLVNNQDRRVAAQDYLSSLDLTEEEYKASKAWFPLLPGVENKRLYDSITVEGSNTNPAADTVVTSNTSAAKKSATGSGPDGVPNVWNSGRPNLVNNQAGQTGTTAQVPARAKASGSNAPRDRNKSGRHN